MMDYVRFGQAGDHAGEGVDRRRTIDGGDGESTTGPTITQSVEC